MRSIGASAPQLARLHHAVRPALLHALCPSCPRTAAHRFLGATASALAGDGDSSGHEESRLPMQYPRQHQQPGVPYAIDAAETAAVVPARAAAGGLSVSEAAAARVTPVIYRAHGFSDEMLGSVSTQPFPPEVVAILHAPLAWDDVASRPVGGGPPVPYLPEIKYRRILNKAFGPGAWALLPVGPLKQEENVVSRDYQLFVFGRLVSEARGKQEIATNKKSVATAMEGVKSNALMRCCKDLGIASELWDPQWIKKWQSRQFVGPARSAPRW